MNEAEAEAREARFRRFNAQQTLINLGLPIRLEQLKGLSDEEMARKLQFLGLPKDVISELDPSTTTANLIPIIVPFDGVVIGREIVTGEVVEPSQPQFVIADVRKMWIMLDVRKEDAFRVALGQDILFETDGVPGDVHCKLTWISTEVDQKTRTVQVRAEVENPLIEPTGGPEGQRRLRANTFGTGRIRVRLQPEAVVVPVNAVQWDGDVNVVFVPGEEGKAFVARQVRIGGTTDDYVEILDGINAGEQVVTSGSHLLKSELERRRALTSN
jgi:cobalt-zinc-cadmium efflux system membrane fusion protein